MYKCKYCNIENNNHQSHAAHVRDCDKNINYEINKKITSEKLIAARAKKRISVKKICPKCNLEFEVIRVNGYIKLKERKFCSDKCSKSRIISDKQKDAISKKLTKNNYKKEKYREKKVRLKEGRILYIRICEYCQKRFETYSKTKRYCNATCASKNVWIRYREKILESTKNINYSEIHKNNYKNGKIQGGGTTKWFTYKNDLRVQGTYELRACIILDKLKELGKISNWEYTNDRIPYFDKNNIQHTYLLDFKVIKNNKEYYIETKGYEKELDFYKWKTVREKGFILKIWKKEHLKKFEKLLNIDKNEFRKYDSGLKIKS